MTEVALVSSGGGSKGAHSAGMWQAIFESRPELYTRAKWFGGTSTGSLIMPMLALSCITGDRTFLYDLVDIYATVQQGDVLKPQDTLAHAVGGLEGLLVSSIVFKRDSLFDDGPLADLVRKYMKGNWKTLIDAPHVVGFCVCNLEAGQTEFISNKTHPDPSTLEKAMLASAAQPVLMGPIEINGVDYVDGGVIDFLPIRFVFDSKIREAICVSTQKPGVPRGENDYPTVMGQLARTLEIMTESAYQNNKFAAEALACKDPMKIEWFEPLTPLVGDALKFEQPMMEKWLVQGYRDALKQMGDKDGLQL